MAAKKQAVAIANETSTAVSAGPAVLNESTALVAMIERAARDPAVDIEKMERLFLMHEKMQARAAEAAYNAAMAAAQAEIAPVAKNKTNEHTNSRYADLYAIADQVMPTIHGHGFGLSFFECPSDKPGHQGIECRVSHAAGHSETHRFNIPVDVAGSQGKVNKTATQAYGSTFTYARRYATCGVFNIAIGDNDGNAQKEPDTGLTEEQEDQLRTALDEANADIAAFCAFFKIDKFADLPAARLKEALNMIELKKKKAAKKEAAQ